MKHSTLRIGFIIIIGSLFASACSSSVAGKYYLEGNNNTYIELKPEGSNYGTFTISGNKIGRYNLDSNTGIYLSESNEKPSVATGTIYKGVIEFTEYYGSKKGYKFIRSESSPGTTTAQSPQTTNQLSNDKAQNAINKWAGQYSDATVRVVGIREIPAENSAQVDVSINNLHWNYDNGIITQKMGCSSCSGIATFSHYNDGRWVLMSIQSQAGGWNSINIEAN